MYEEMGAGDERARTGFGEYDAAQDVRGLNDMIEEANMQSEKLLQMVNELMKMLEPVRRAPGETAAVMDSPLKKIPAPFGSQYAERVYSAVERMKIAQSKIGTVMSDLDVR